MQLMIRMEESWVIVERRHPISLVEVSSDTNDCWLEVELFFFRLTSLIRWHDRELKDFDTNSCNEVCLRY